MSNPSDPFSNPAAWDDFIDDEPESAVDEQEVEAEKVEPGSNLTDSEPAVFQKEKAEEVVLSSPVTPLVEASPASEPTPTQQPVPAEPLDQAGESKPEGDPEEVRRLAEQVAVLQRKLIQEQEANLQEQKSDEAAVQSKISSLESEIQRLANIIKTGPAHPPASTQQSPPALPQTQQPTPPVSSSETSQQPNKPKLGAAFDKKRRN